MPIEINKAIKCSLFNELNKIATGSYKCPECGYDPHDNELDNPDYCPICGSSMATGGTAETHVNS